MSFYKPKHKWQLIAFLERQYPGEKKFKSMNKAQLYAIYYNLRKKED